MKNPAWSRCPKKAKVLRSRSKADRLGSGTCFLIGDGRDRDEHGPAAKISPRVAGKAVKIMASQGDRVRDGQALAHLDSVELDQVWADYRKAQGKVELARKSLQREETLFQKKISRKRTCRKRDKSWEKRRRP